jgi:hypothetical protein
MLDGTRDVNALGSTDSVAVFGGMVRTLGNSNADGSEWVGSLSGATERVWISVAGAEDTLTGFTAEGSPEVLGALAFGALDFEAFTRFDAGKLSGLSKGFTWDAVTSSVGDSAPLGGFVLSNWGTLAGASAEGTKPGMVSAVFSAASSSPQPSSKWTARALGAILIG